MDSPAPPSGDFNPYAPPTSKLAGEAPFEVTGGLEFRGELTAEDRQRASRLRVQAAFWSPWMLLLLAAFPFVLASMFGFSTLLVGTAALAMFCAGLAAVWSRYTWWLTFELELPPGAFQGRASLQGLQFASPDWTFQVPWSAVEGYLSDEDLIVLYIEARAMAVPKRAVADERAWAQLCETLLRARVRPLG